jgi:hypothetical protein
MDCGYPCSNGRPCGLRAPCGVHTEAFKEEKERQMMGRADRRSRAVEQQMLPKCGYTCRDGTACTHLLPCPFHERKRKAEAEAARERCGFMGRDGAACTHTLPCPAHAVEQGTKECSSTLDGDPFARCRRKVQRGELFCDCHKPFPDLGRQAAIYMDGCKRRGEPPRLDHFLAQHYGGAALVVPIHDFPKYCESMHKKFRQ